MDVGVDDAQQAAQDLFRPSKRKRLYRKRAEDDNEGSHKATPPPTFPLSPIPSNTDPLIGQATGASEPPELSADEAHESIQEILRRRKAAQKRRGGIEFTNSAENSASSRPYEAGDAPDGEQQDEDLMEVERLGSRFAPQTGHVAEAADKHMMSYIDSELARLHSQSLQYNQIVHLDGTDQASQTTAAKYPDARQPAALGRIHEIDLGPDSKARNVALTEAATQRRLLLRQGIDPDAVEEKPRLRRDGKPFRRRRRRNSDDIKRDKLVEEVLRESNLNIYDDVEGEEKSKDRGRRAQPSSDGLRGPEGLQKKTASRRDEPMDDPDEVENDEGNNNRRYASSTASSEDEEAADDRIAEQFRRDFMEQVYARRRQRAPIPGSARAKARELKKAPDYVSKGPKLGGSRSARAKLRERQLEEAAAASKKR